MGAAPTELDDHYLQPSSLFPALPTPAGDQQVCLRPSCPCHLPVVSPFFPSAFFPSEFFFPVFSSGNSCSHGLVARFPTRRPDPHLP